MDSAQPENMSFFSFFRRDMDSINSISVVFLFPSASIYSSSIRMNSENSFASSSKYFLIAWTQLSFVSFSNARSRG